jgi:hypothetical protein
MGLSGKIPEDAVLEHIEHCLRTWGAKPHVGVSLLTPEDARRAVETCAAMLEECERHLRKVRALKRAADASAFPRGR